VQLIVTAGVLTGVSSHGHCQEQCCRPDSCQKVPLHHTTKKTGRVSTGLPLCSCMLCMWICLHSLFLW
jgi:hypothetical protein